MNKLEWITAALAAVMVLLALGGAKLSAQEAGGAMTAAAAGLAVALAWLSGKLEKPVRLLGPSMGATAVLAVCLLLKDAAAMKRFLLILAMLLAILWLVGSMIRRHLTERK